MELIKTICVGVCAIVGICGLAALAGFLYGLIQVRWGLRKTLLARYDSVTDHNRSLERDVTSLRKYVDVLEEQIETEEASRQKPDNVVD